MSAVAYTVSVTFADAKLADEWLRWLRGGHLTELLSGGASDAEVIELDGGPCRSFEVRYHFPSRTMFEDYERDHAPRLRAEGLRLFGPEKGAVYRRSLGTVVTTSPEGERI